MPPAAAPAKPRPGVVGVPVAAASQAATEQRGDAERAALGRRRGPRYRSDIRSSSRSGGARLRQSDVSHLAHDRSFESRLKSRPLRADEPATA